MNRHRKNNNKNKVYFFSTQCSNYYQRCFLRKIHELRISKFKTSVKALETRDKELSLVIFRGKDEAIIPDAKTIEIKVS